MVRHRVSGWCGLAALSCFMAVMNAAAMGLALPGGLISPEVTAVISNGSAILASLNGIRPLMYRK